MQAQETMTRNPVTAMATETVGTALERMVHEGLRLLPVLDGSGVVQGVVTEFSVMAHVLPNYISTGDLDDVTYAPDFGLLRRHYDELLGQPVTMVLDTQPVLVKPDASLLSVASALITHGKHESALVVDEQKKLLGVVSVGDVLTRLKSMPEGPSGA